MLLQSETKIEPDLRLYLTMQSFHTKAPSPNPHCFYKCFPSNNGSPTVSLRASSLGRSGGRGKRKWSLQLGLWNLNSASNFPLAPRRLSCHFSRFSLTITLKYTYPLLHKTLPRGQILAFSFERKKNKASSDNAERSMCLRLQYVRGTSETLQRDL